MALPRHKVHSCISSQHTHSAQHPNNSETVYGMHKTGKYFYILLVLSADKKGMLPYVDSTVCTVCGVCAVCATCTVQYML